MAQVGRDCGQPHTDGRGIDFAAGYDNGLVSGLDFSNYGGTWCMCLETRDYWRQARLRALASGLCVVRHLIEDGASRRRPTPEEEDSRGSAMSSASGLDAGL